MRNKTAPVERLAADEAPVHCTAPGLAQGCRRRGLESRRLARVAPVVGAAAMGMLAAGCNGHDAGGAGAGRHGVGCIAGEGRRAAPATDRAGRAAGTGALIRIPVPHAPDTRLP